MNLSIEQCNNLINLSESKNSWTRTRHINTSYRSYPVNIDEVSDIKDLIIEYCKKYINLDVITVNLGVLKYLTGDHLGRHNDYGGNKFTEDFVYNINVRLNDDYKGGEFYLDDSLYNKPVGELYHYKSSQYHEVKKVTEGIRYSAIFYIRYRDIKKEPNSKKII